MNCKWTQSLIHGYLDKELDLVSVKAVDEHLRSCAACRKVLDQQLALGNAIKQFATYHAIPGDLVNRVVPVFPQANSASGDGNLRARRWTGVLRLPRPEWLRLVAAMTITALITWTVALTPRQAPETDRISDQVVASYSRSLLTSHIMDVASSDQHTVKPWLSSKLDFSPPVVDLARAGCPLAGARLDYLDGRPVAALVYRRHGQYINLFIWPQSHQNVPMQLESKHGYNVMHWTDAGMTFWAISDIEPAEMKTFARTFASAV